MKLIIGFLLMVSLTAVIGEYTCSIPEANVPNVWIDMSDACTNSVRNQIQMEVDASFAYLAMGAYFSRDTVNRPGFAETFFKSAREEREHARALIEYLLMRGQLTTSITNLIGVSNVKEETWEDGTAALTTALRLESDVTKSIREVIAKCEKAGKFNDYHFVDYLTGVFLEEQYKGQREIAGKLATLSKMKQTHGALGEFLFDKTLLE